jgi:hypothetical protein
MLWLLFSGSVLEERIRLPPQTTVKAPTFVRRMWYGCSGTFHFTGKSIVGASGFWSSTKLIPTICFSSFLRKKRIPWNRHVSPAQRRVQDTQRGNGSDRYRLDMQRANCSSGWSGPDTGADCASPSPLGGPLGTAVSTGQKDVRVDSCVWNYRREPFLCLCPSQAELVCTILGASIALPSLRQRIRDPRCGDWEPTIVCCNLSSLAPFLRIVTAFR